MAAGQVALFVKHPCASLATYHSAWAIKSLSKVGFASSRWIQIFLCSNNSMASHPAHSMHFQHLTSAGTECAPLWGKCHVRCPSPSSPVLTWGGTLVITHGWIRNQKLTRDPSSGHSKVKIICYDDLKGNLMLTRELNPNMKNFLLDMFFYCTI